jgi:NADPH:quinone reductase-like Zn-dependent oxidoreductase
VGELCNGTCCEQIAVPADAAIPIPELLSFEDAASIPLVFLTAWRMLITRGKLKPGEDALILGAAGGVGTAAIQIAKAAGARVLAAAGSEEKLDLCRGLGADVLFNYSKEDFVKGVKKATSRRGVDVVIDFVGADTWVKSLQSLVRGGRLLTCGATTGYTPQTDLRHIFYRQLKIIGSTMGSKNDLTSALKMILDGRMRPVVGAVYDLEDTAKAHAAIEERRVLGKIVIRIG